MEDTSASYRKINKLKNHDILISIINQTPEIYHGS